MQTLYSFSVFLHVLAACVWIGSMVFFAAVAIPVLRRPEYRGVFPDLVRQLGGRFRRLGWGALTVLVVTGVGNLALRGIGMDALTSSSFWSSEFGHALACKLGFVLLVIASTASHDALAMRSRRASAFLGRAALLFSLVVVLFAVSLVRGLP